MHTTDGNSKKLVVLGVLGGLLLGLNTMATAESDAVRAIYLSAANVPTNIATIHTYAEPPKGFNPLAASDEELAAYGFPTRPDKQADPDHYRLWERAMAAAKIRAHGELKPLHVNGHGAMQAHSLSARPIEQVQPQPQSGPKQDSNINAAGVILDNGVKKWSSKTSFDDIYSLISVPTTQAPFGAVCGQPEYISVSLVGIDGELVSFGGPTVFLPGESAAAYTDVICGDGVYYYATIGWEDNFDATFTMNPGDLFYTELHAYGDCSNGTAFVEDLTTLTYGSYTIDNPCNFQQIGRFANFAVWRPCCDGPGPDGAYQLANSAAIFFDGGAVLNGAGTHFYPGSQAGSTTIFTMTDDAGDQDIELVNQGAGTGYEGLHGLFFSTTGCAWSGGCTP